MLVSGTVVSEFSTDRKELFLKKSCAGALIATFIVVKRAMQIAGKVPETMPAHRPACAIATAPVR
jgi:hypothetical protein